MLVGFALVAGLALVFHERALDITFGKFASIKAAAQQATADAKEIAAIRNRVEAQAATLDLVAKASSDAKTLLDELREETKTADDKLKQLEKKTAEIVQLPDGRTKMGGMISGTPSILIEQVNQFYKAIEAGDQKGAYALGKKAITIYEESVAMSAGAGFSVGSINTQGLASLYEKCALLASNYSEHALAEGWMIKALGFEGVPARKAKQVAVLLRAGKEAEAKKIVDEILPKGDADAQAFSAELKALGILKE
jgi:flagellar biosynthesis chaperone FliJ